MKTDTTRKTIYRFRNGSHMYGLNTPSSDVDFMEVFLPAPEDVLGLKQVEVIDQSTKSSAADRRNNEDDVDDQRYTLQRYLQLLLANNPNILETLFVPTGMCETRDPLLNPILKHPERIVCKDCYKTFNGYAKSQEHKLLEKKARYDELCFAVASLEREYARDILDTTAKMSSELAEVLNSVLKHYKGAKHNIESFHEGLPMKIVYEKLREERDTYGWRVKTTTFDTLGYCVKFGYHLLRLYYEADSLLKTGAIEFPFKGTQRETLMAIKTGKVSLEDLLELCKEAKFESDLSYTLTELPDNPDRDYVNDYLVKTTLEHFRGSEVY
jgi:predicted nucleotidyltransferase